MRYAFTGPSFVTDSDRNRVGQALLALEVPTHVTTGGASGVDVLVAELALALWPRAKHRIVVPGARYDHERVAQLAKYGAEVVHAPSGATPAAAYRLRNEAMLLPHDDTTLIAFLRSLDFYRSGEWMTVNIATKAGLPVVRFLL